MKNSKRLILAMAVTLIFFFAISGCKIKQKSATSSSDFEQTRNLKEARTYLETLKKTSFFKIDTTKLIHLESEKNESKRTVEMTFELDSGKKSFKSDTSGGFSLSRLIHAALENAKSLKIKVEQQQFIEKSKQESTNHGLTLFEQDSTAHKFSKQESTDEEKEKKSHSNSLDKKKDDSIKTNLGAGWVIIPIGLLFMFIIYQKFK